MITLDEDVFLGNVNGKKNTDNEHINKTFPHNVLIFLKNQHRLRLKKIVMFAVYLLDLNQSAWSKKKKYLSWCGL